MKLFYYLIDLHYSQTRPLNFRAYALVLLPYRFTLFSNELHDESTAELGFTTL